MKSFTEEGKLREFIASRFAPRELLEILGQTGNKARKT